MKLATWNVNSLKVRLAQVLEFLAAQKPDVLVLQETKLEDDRFSLSDLNTAGYQAGDRRIGDLKLFEIFNRKEVFK